MGLTPEVKEAPKVKGYSIDLSKLIPAAQAADVEGFDAADKDFAARFPGLVAGRTAAMNQTLKDLQGPPDAFTTESVNKGIAKSLNAGFGGGTGAVEGIGRNTVGSTVANRAEGFQDMARSNLDELFQENPSRWLGLTGDEILNLKFNNMDAINQAIQQQKGANFQNSQAQAQASAQGTQALVGIGESVLSAL